MKLLKTIIATTLALLAVQLLCFFILFVAWFFRFILQWFVTLGSSQRESWLESLLQIVIKVFTYPARLFFEDIQASENVFTLVLQLGVGSAIWGIGLGIIIYVIRQWRQPEKVT